MFDEIDKIVSLPILLVNFWIFLSEKNSFIIKFFIAILKNLKFIGIIPEPYIKGIFSKSIWIASQFVIPPERLNNPIIKIKLLSKGFKNPITVNTSATKFVTNDLLMGNILQLNFKNKYY